MNSAEARNRIKQMFDLVRSEIRPGATLWTGVGEPSLSNILRPGSEFSFDVAGNGWGNGRCIQVGNTILASVGNGWLYPGSGMKIEKVIGREHEKLFDDSLLGLMALAIANITISAQYRSYYDQEHQNYRNGYVYARRGGGRKRASGIGELDTERRSHTTGLGWCGDCFIECENTQLFDRLVELGQADRGEDIIDIN